MDIAALQRRFKLILRPAATIYSAAMRLRALRYTAKTSAFSYRASCPVVSVGNISWGGTGKTPLVDYLLDKTAEAGLRTVVLTRGYKATPPQLPFLVTPTDDPQTTGDEPLFLARRHPEALVLVDPKRGRAAAWAETNAAPDLFLLDDGMQHLALQRDLDIVLLKPDDLLDGWNKVIPAGTWREGATALTRATAFCMKVDEAVFSSIIPMAEKRLASLKGKPVRPLFSFDLVATGLSRLIPYGQGLPEITPDLGGEPYTLVCGTGNPEQVTATANSLLGRHAGALIVADHHHYTAHNAATLCKAGKPVVCTAKDAVKLAALLPHFGNIPVWILDVRMVFGPALFTTKHFDTWWKTSLEHLPRKNL